MHVRNKQRFKDNGKQAHILFLTDRHRDFENQNSNSYKAYFQNLLKQKMSTVLEQS
jgi:hypothetical protein